MSTAGVHLDGIPEEGNYGDGEEITCLQGLGVRSKSDEIGATERVFGGVGLSISCSWRCLIYVNCRPKRSILLYVNCKNI